MKMTIEDLDKLEAELDKYLNTKVLCINDYEYFNKDSFYKFCKHDFSVLRVDIDNNTDKEDDVPELKYSYEDEGYITMVDNDNVRHRFYYSWFIKNFELTTLQEVRRRKIKSIL